MRHKSSDFRLCGMNKVNSNVNVDNMTRMPKTVAENPKKNNNMYSRIKDIILNENKNGNSTKIYTFYVFIQNIMLMLRLIVEYVRRIKGEKTPINSNNNNNNRSCIYIFLKFSKLN